MIDSRTSRTLADEAVIGVLVYLDAESGKRLTLPDGERITEAELGTRFKPIRSFT